MRRSAAAGLVLGGVLLSSGGSVTAWASGPRVERLAWAETSEYPNPAFAPAAGRLYASARLGKEEARSYVVIDLGTANSADIEGLTLRLAEGEDSVRPEDAALVACALAEPLPSDDELALGELPATNCELRVDGVRAGGQSSDVEGHPAVWAFDLGLFLDPWLSGANDGLAIFPDLGPSDDQLPLNAGSPDTYRIAFARTDAWLDVAFAPSAHHPSDHPSASQQIPPARAVPPAIAPDPVAYDVGPALATAEPPSSPPSRGPENEISSPTTIGSMGSANSPQALLLLGIVGAVLAAVIALDRVGVVSIASIGERAASARLGGRAAGWLAAGAAVVALPPILFDDSTLFKWGFVLIFVIAASGMHVLVNWTGQLSLAHAGMIGLPAFAVGKLSVDHGVSPIVLLPVALLVGGLLGAVVALPALRVRGYYIAVITLAAGVAIERFFFTREWLIGPGALSVPRASLGPIEFNTFSGLYPWFALVFVGVMAALLGLYGSKVARAFWWVKSDPDAAAAAGVNASSYVILAYVIAGTLAGLAGGLTTIWVRQLTPTNFPLSLAFSYLIIAVLAGPGPITGLLVTVFVLQGLPLFNEGVGTLVGYAGPVAVLVILTRFPGGVNALGPRLMQTAAAKRVRTLARSINERGGTMETVKTGPSRTLILGASLIVIGLASIGVAWYHTGNTDQVWIQMQEVASGGLGGLALVIVGTGLVVRDQIALNAALVASAIRTPAIGMSGQQFVFPIADYDELRVFEVLPLLDELYADELEVVRQREQATKARAGVLTRIEALTEGDREGSRARLALETGNTNGEVGTPGERHQRVAVRPAR